MSFTVNILPSSNRTAASARYSISGSFEVPPEPIAEQLAASRPPQLLHMRRDCLDRGARDAELTGGADGAKARRSIQIRPPDPGDTLAIGRARGLDEIDHALREVTGEFLHAFPQLCAALLGASSSMPCGIVCSRPPCGPCGCAGAIDGAAAVLLTFTQPSSAGAASGSGCAHQPIHRPRPSGFHRFA